MVEIKIQISQYLIINSNYSVYIYFLSGPLPSFSHDQALEYEFPSKFPSN